MTTKTQPTSTDHLIDVLMRLRDELNMSDRRELPVAHEALVNANAILKTYGK